MPLLAVALVVLLAAYLTVSAAAKVVHPAPAIAALVALGLPRRLAGASVLGVASLEVVVAGSIVLWPRAGAAQAACLLLFAAFAAVGAFAVARGRRVECGCLGAIRRSTLGRAQVAQLAVVVPSLVVVDRFAPVWEAEIAAATLVLVQVAAAALLVLYALPVWRRIRRDRVSLASVRVRTREYGLTLAAADEPGRS